MELREPFRRDSGKAVVQFVQMIRVPFVQAIENSLEISGSPDGLGFFLFPFGVPMLGRLAEEHGVHPRGEIGNHPESEQSPQMKAGRERGDNGPEERELPIPKHPEPFEALFEVRQGRKQEA